MEKINQFEKKLSKYSSTYLFVFLAIVGIITLFLALTSAYWLSKPQWTWSKFKFPKLFLISTVLLGLSSYTINKVILFFKQDNLKRFKKFVGLTLLLGVLFLVLQVASWFQLNKSGIYLAGKPDGSYLYLISALHALHLIVGIALLFYIWFIAKYKLIDPIKKLMYFNNKTNLQRLKLIAIYWHFVDVLWIYLLMFFLFNHL